MRAGLTKSEPTWRCGHGTTPALLPVQHNLAATSALHQLKTLAVCGGGKAVGDDLADIEAALEHRQHLVPGFEHFAAVDTLHRQHLQNQRRPVDRERLCRKAEHRDLAAHHEMFDHLFEGGGRAAHLEPDVE